MYERLAGEVLPVRQGAAGVLHEPDWNGKWYYKSSELGMQASLVNNTNKNL